MRMIIVDVGCHRHEAEESVEKLVSRFAPELLLGFDPHPQLLEGLMWLGDTLVVRRRAAAWTWDGVVRFRVDGTRSAVVSRTMDREGNDYVACFDLSSLILSLPMPIVLKLDAEGAEYPLFSHLHRTDADARLERVLVEWHPASPHARRVPTLRCPVEEW